jgi:hypothetical protein
MTQKFQLGDKLVDSVCSHRTFEVTKVHQLINGFFRYDLKILSTRFNFESVGYTYKRQDVGTHLELLKAKDSLGHPLTKIFK